MTCMTKEELELNINSLVQQQLSGSGLHAKSTDKCNKCGSLGHWSRGDPVCPKSQSNNSNNGNNAGRQNNTNGNANNNANANRRNNRNQNRPDWKKTAPGPGQPETKNVNGKSWKWCTHCTKWSTTHGTGGHQGTKKDLEGEAAIQSQWSRSLLLEK